MNVDVIDESGDPLQPIDLEELAVAVLEAEGLPGDSEVTLAIVSEKRITALNEQHMGKDGPTDVLSFPIEDLTPRALPPRTEAGPPLHLGDVFISPEVVRRNAAEFGVSFEDEMALMAVHGILHLLGYDHVDDSDAALMEGRERELLAAAGRVRR